MNISDMDQPLGQLFHANPYQFLQQFVRNMNNQIFLSQYQLNHLYALLLLKKRSPWDQVKPNNDNMKITIEQIVNHKLQQVKKILEGLSQVYEHRVKKSTFGQIQKLMNIIKAKDKSIFIEKDMEYIHKIHKKKQQERKLNMQQEKQSNTQINQQVTETATNEQQNKTNKQHKKPKQSVQQQQKQICQHSSGDQRQVLSLFYGLSNISNLSTLALSNCIQFSSSQRYIKFKMSRNYIMTIKNQDQQYFDRQSTLKNVSTDLFTHHIFPYLTAVELFKSRAVCKEWMENVKEAWHSTFKRQMFIQLMACQFCKEIQYYYKMIQLRNPFFQKISLLMHALIQIIQWDKVIQSIQNNSIVLLQKRVLIILLKLIGQQIPITNVNSITQQIWAQQKHKILTIKQRVSQFLTKMNSSTLSIYQLIQIKVHLLDDPFIRIDQVNTQDKTPLLLVIFIKQLTLQQILKNHIFFSQEYLMNTKSRLDNVSSKMPQQKGFLEGVYKILLLRNLNPSMMKNDNQQNKSQMPNFEELLTSIFSNSESSKPDFVIRAKSNSTSIYLDKATKLDIIMSTVRKIKQSTNDNEMLNQNQNQNQNQGNQIEIQQDQKQKQFMQVQNQTIFNHQPKKQLKNVNVFNINLNINVNSNKNKCDFQQNIYEDQIDKEQAQKNKKMEEEK